MMNTSCVKSERCLWLVPQRCEDFYIKCFPEARQHKEGLHLAYERTLV